MPRLGGLNSSRWARRASFEILHRHLQDLARPSSSTRAKRNSTSWMPGLARAIAEGYFDSDKVLGRFADEVGVRP